jgi:hypothetical protein
VKLGKSATKLLKCFVRLLENILLAGQLFLNGIHVSRPVECQLKMTNVQDYQAPAKRQKMLKKFENSSTKTIAEQSMSLQTPLGWISYGVCQEILTVKTGTLAQPQLGPSSRQRACTHIPENHRVFDQQQHGYPQN